MSDTQPSRILLVDDEADIVELLTYNLEREGYKVKVAYNGKKALEVAKGFLPHLVIMDIMLPEIDGIETARRMREIQELEQTYILFLTARTEEYAQIAAFEIGGNDYITKPIKPRALLSRIHALLNRGSRQEKRTDILSFGHLVIDKNKYVVLNKGVELILPRKEFELLVYLFQHPHTIVTREDILQAVWGRDVYVLSRTVDVHIRKIREKIGEDYIKTVKGVGYMFEPPALSV
jgi:two-component system alkaline phosphatase synthesis response regulator PhoP